jgi:transcriptional regulator with XRE-family HTH domain
MPNREWGSWMRDLGSTLRRARELAGLTQAAVSEAAGVSQAAVSRLENGQGMATPLVCVLRVLLVLRRSLGLLPMEEVRDDVRRLLELGAPGGAGTPLELAPGLVELLEFYRRLGPREREQFAQVALSTAKVLFGHEQGAAAAVVD